MSTASVRRGPKGKQLQPRAWVPALRPLAFWLVDQLGAVLLALETQPHGAE